MSEETKTKLIKTAKGALIAGGGVALTYFLQIAGSLDFGVYSALAAGLAAALINAVKEWVRTYEK